MAAQKRTDTAGVDSLDTVVAQVRQKYGDGAIMRLGEGAVVKSDLVRSGAVSIDRALGGGWPLGRIIEVYGPESSGKTTICLHAIAAVQKLKKTAAFIDAEHALDPAYARRIGVDTDQLLMSQPDNGEQALDIAEDLVNSGLVSLIVIDSVAALTPKAEIEGTITDHQVGLQARMMSKAMRRLTALVSKKNCSLIFTNQLRMKIGVLFGSPETTTGGNALKFYASIRLDVRRLGQIKIGDDVAGSRVRIRVVKNKLAPAARTAEFDIMYNEGISQAGDILDLACDQGLIAKSGSWFSYKDEKIAQGREAAKQYLRDKPDVIAELDKQIRENLGLPAVA